MKRNIRMLVLAIAATLLAVTVNAQEQRRLPDLPQSPAAGSSAVALVPRGWVVEKQAEGDLNGTPAPTWCLG